MRFYWFDGKAPQGPLEIAELLAQPGFSAETVVCPVGAERPEDWKPAVNYEPLRDALFKPKPVLLSAPPALLASCPSCRQPNADDALFCSHCGRALKEPAPSPAAPPISPALPKPPELSAGPKRGPAPGTMGRLAQQPPAQVPAAARPPEAKPPGAAPSRPAPVLAAGKGKKTLLLAGGAFCAAFLVLAGIFLWRRGAAPKAPPALDLAPPAEAKLGTQEGSPAPSVAQPMEAPAKAPEAKPPAAPAKPRAPARKPRAAASAPASAPLEPPAGPAEPSDAELGKLLKTTPKPAQPAARKPDEEMLLPGIPKKIRKASEESGASEPSGPEEVLKERAKEQFNFCHQLMRQGNFGDFFDTCLCTPSRQADPYKGRRRVFIEKASEDPAGELGSTAEIVSVLLEGETARIAAKWSGPDGPVERTEKWVVEDGLWCLQK